jgi:hypothetical protein
MATVRVGIGVGDDERRRDLYKGTLYALPPTTAGLELCAFGQSLLEEAFAPHDPREAQFHMPVEEFVARFAPVKPKFIHHPKTMGLLQEVVRAVGCDVDDTYIDVPRLRGVTSDGYLTSGVGYAHHPHRDTWYSAPMAQLNWWMPIYPFVAESSMDFHPRYFDEGVDNSSETFSYYDWNAKGRKEAAAHITSDTRQQPKAKRPEELELEPAIRFVCDVGGVVLFSGAQLHSTVPNTSGLGRFSTDFRTVSLSDLRSGRGAPNVDSAPRGTSLRDFRRASDLEAVPDDVVALYDDAVAVDGELVFQAK